MNWDKITKAANRRIELQPRACFLDAMGRELPEVSDDWVISNPTPDHITVTNTRTQHVMRLGKDHIHHFTSNPLRSPDGNDHGFFTLLVQIYIQGDAVSFRPCLRPGEKLPPVPPIEIEDKWVDQFYPSAANLAHKLGVDPQMLAWCRESRVPSLVAGGNAEIALERIDAGRMCRLRLRDSPEPQMLIRRLPPKE
jgi:hypothetical protein